MTEQRREAAIAGLVKAWSDHGPVPAAHRQAQIRLMDEWPTLANAINELITAQAFHANPPTEILTLVSHSSGPWPPSAVPAARRLNRGRHKAFRPVRRVLDVEGVIGQLELGDEE